MKYVALLVIIILILVVIFPLIFKMGKALGVYFKESLNGDDSTRGTAVPHDEKLIGSGFFHLYMPVFETEPVLVHAYYNGDAKAFGFGYNVHDGAGFLPLSDLSEEAIIIPVKIMEMG